jgi:hypothetical protein
MRWEVKQLAQLNVYTILSRFFLFEKKNPANVIRIKFHVSLIFSCRSSDEWSSEDPINNNKMYENLIEDGDDYPAVVTKPITMFDILKKRILTQKIAPPESAELMITPFR